MLQKLRNIILYFYLKFKKKEQKRQPISLQNAKKIGFLFHAENIKWNEVLLQFSEHLKQHHKDVQLLGYVSKRDIASSYPFPYISDKDTTWYGKPGGGTTGYFTRSPFDLMINFCTDECLPLEYITAVSASKFRVGFNKDIHNANYDLILISNEKHNISNLIQNLEKYLN